MACWQFLYFRKNAYKRRVSAAKYDRRRHRRNIRRKLRQQARASAGIASNVWALPVTGGLSAANVVVHTRRRSIARQKLRALEEAWRDKHPGCDVPYLDAIRRRGFCRRVGDCLRSFCCCVFGCVVDDDGVGSVMSDVVDEVEDEVGMRSSTDQGLSRDEDDGTRGQDGVDEKATAKDGQGSNNDADRKAGVSGTKKGSRKKDKKFGSADTKAATVVKQEKEGKPSSGATASKSVSSNEHKSSSPKRDGSSITASGAAPRSKSGTAPNIPALRSEPTVVTGKPPPPVKSSTSEKLKQKHSWSLFDWTRRSTPSLDDSTRRGNPASGQQGTGPGSVDADPNAPQSDVAVVAGAGIVVVSGACITAASGLATSPVSVAANADADIASLARQSTETHACAISGQRNPCASGRDRSENLPPVETPCADGPESASAHSTSVNSSIDHPSRSSEDDPQTQGSTEDNGR